MTTIRFLHGWHSVPGGVKPTHLKDHGFEVINPCLDDDNFDAAVRIAQAEFEEHQSPVVVGSSRGGAVAMNINCGNAKLVWDLSCIKKIWGGQHGQVRHRDPAPPCRRRDPVCRQ